MFKTSDILLIKIYFYLCSCQSAMKPSKPMRVQIFINKVISNMIWSISWVILAKSTATYIINTLSSAKYYKYMFCKDKPICMYLCVYVCFVITITNKVVHLRFHLRTNLNGCHSTVGSTLSSTVGSTLYQLNYNSR